MQEMDSEMQKAIEFAKKEFNTVRAGKANPALLDNVSALFYGTPTPLKQMANISASDGRTLTVTPYDPGCLKDIEKAINESDLGLTANNDGKIIRIAIPVPTEEERKKLVKIVKDYAEKARIAVRNARRDANERVKKDSEATEDDKKKLQEDIQKETDKYIKEIDELLKHKEEEIMTV